MNKLIFANLLHRPLRSVISVLAVAIEVIMILSIVAIFTGMLNDQNQRTNGIGADLMLLPSNASLFNGLGSPSMPDRGCGSAAKTAPRRGGFARHPEDHDQRLRGDSLTASTTRAFNALKPFKFLAGGPFQGPNDAIIDDLLAATQESSHREDRMPSDDTITIMDHPFRVSGIVEQGKGGRKLIPIDTMGQMVDAEGKASIFYIKCDNPANDDLRDAGDSLEHGFENNTLTTVDSWLDQMTPDKIPGFKIALEVITGIAVIIGFLVIFQSMYTAVLERTREIGILKSMGASKMTIVGVVLRECAVLSAAGVILGIAGTYGARTLIAHIFPTMNFEITVQWLTQSALIAFVGSICGALYPAWMAARKDPIDALAYE